MRWGTVVGERWPGSIGRPHVSDAWWVTRKDGWLEAVAR